MVLVEGSNIIGKEVINDSMEIMRVKPSVCGLIFSVPISSVCMWTHI